MLNETQIKEKEMTLLEAFVMVAPYLNKITQDDISVSVYDTDRLLRYVPAETFSLNLKLGEPLIEGDILHTAIKNNKGISGVVPEELFGVPFASKVMPILDENGKVIGGIGVGSSLEKATELMHVAESLSAVVEQTAASIEKITNSASVLAERMADVSKHMDAVSLGANQIGQISKVVKEVSNQSNLLGLNASIEAARAGEAGRGFSIVADEIRKLAASSKENVTQIDEITKGMQNAILNFSTAFSGIDEFTSNQAKTIEQILATVQGISANAQQLARMAGLNAQDIK